MELTVSLTEIAIAARDRESENEEFKTFLRSQETDKIDHLVQELDAIVTPQIDCTTCGNCCRSLMINVEPAELTALATHLCRSEADVKAQYVETGSGDMMVINKIPCHFLSDNRCTIYEHRFAGCREFPGLHLPNFTKRLFYVFEHYGRCPIMFNVVEELKQRSGFK